MTNEAMRELARKVLWSLCQCHDQSELWEHTRRDPEAFIQSVVVVLQQELGDGRRE